MRELTGRGRRGGAGAADAALGAITGGSLSEMEFEIGGRTIRGSDRGASRTLMGILRRGGEGGAELMNQLRSRLTEMGVTGDDATNMINTLSAGVADGERGGLSETAARELMTMTGSNRELARISTEASTRMAEARDPLGVARNTLLTEIRDTLRDRLAAPNSGSGTGGVPTGEAE
jgi:hypothetical protein